MQCPRCPQCTCCLFRLDNRTLEKLVKLTIATWTASLPLSVISFFWASSQYAIIYNYFMSLLGFMLLLVVLDCRENNFAEWWKEFEVPGVRSERNQIRTQIVFTTIAVCWMLGKAVEVERLAPVSGRFLWEMLCG